MMIQYSVGTLTLILTLLNPNICAHIVDTHINFFTNL